MLEIHLIETIHRDRQQEIERKLEIRRLLRETDTPATTTVPADRDLDRMPDRSSSRIGGARSAVGGR
jgi:hypothetical protein